MAKMSQQLCCLYTPKYLAHEKKKKKLEKKTNKHQIWKVRKKKKKRAQYAVYGLSIKTFSWLTPL